MRPGLDAIAPERIGRLPVCPTRKIPIPWFVAWVDGRPEFRVADAEKYKRAVRERLCWVCGEPLGRTVAFVIGPICSINRISGDPPSHRDCAEFSVRACPFLTKPQMVRREGGLPEDTHAGGGLALMHNPGASLVWMTRDYRLVPDGRGGRLFSIGDPEAVSWWKEGRAATRADVADAFAVGLPKLEAMIDGPAERELFDRMRAKAETLLPAELPDA